MSTADNAQQGHAVLRAIFTTLALGVLLACLVMGWWVHGRDDGNGSSQTAQIVDARASHG